MNLGDGYGGSGTHRPLILNTKEVKTGRIGLGGERNMKWEET